MYRAAAGTVKCLALAACLLGSPPGAVGGDDQERIDRAQRFEERLATWQARVLEGDGEAVLAEAEAVSGGEARDPRLFNVRGLACAALGRTPEAVAHYEQGIRLDPTRPELHLNLAVALLTLGATGRALSEFEQTLELDPDSVDARLGLGSGLVRLGRFGPAVEVLEAAARRSPDDARVLRALAEAVDGLGDPERSRGVWTALERAAPSADTARRLGEFERVDGPAAARGHFDDCVARDPAATDCAEAAAALALEAGDPAGARDQLAPRLPELTEVGVLNLLISYQRLGDAESVAALLARRKPHLGSAWGVVALVRRAASDRAGGLLAVRRALELEPTNADLHSLLGVLLEETGDRPGARAAWLRALDLDPQHAQAQANLRATHEGP